MVNPDFSDPLMKIIDAGEKFRLEKRAMEIITDQTMKAVTGAIEKSKGPLARLIQQDQGMLGECRRAFTEAILRQSGKGLMGVVRKEDVNREDFQGSVDFAIEQGMRMLLEYLAEAEDKRDLTPFISDPHVLSEFEKQLLRVYEERGLQPHFATLLKSGEYVLEPLTEKHIPEVLNFFREYLIKESSLKEIMVGEYSSDAFLNDPEAVQNGPHMSEGPKMRLLLPRTAELLARHPKSMRLRREKETMHGVVVRTKLKKIVSVVILTEAPYNPKKDKDYWEENTELVDRGNSGGKITYLQSEYRDMYAAHLLGKGNTGVLSGKLFLVITREPGTGQYAFAAGVHELSDMDPEAMMFTYTKGDLTLLKDGKILPRSKSSGQNRNFMRSAVPVGWEVKAVDENVNDPGKPFELTLDDGPGIVHARASWIDYAMLHKDLDLWARGILPRPQHRRILPMMNFPPRKK